MLEILALVGLCRYVGRVVREKGRTAVGWQVLLVALWFFGEFAGGLIGAIVTYDPGNPEAVNPVAYVFALVGAAAGAAIGTGIAKLLPPA